jgi:hypothetical protein
MWEVTLIFVKKHYDCQRLTRASRHDRHRGIMIWVMPQLWEFFISSSRAYRGSDSWPVGRSCTRRHANWTTLGCSLILFPRTNPSSQCVFWFAHVSFLYGVPDLATRTKPSTTKNVNVFFYLMPTDCRKSTAFRKVPRIVLLVRAMRRWWVWNTGGMIMTGGK